MSEQRHLAPEGGQCHCAELCPTEPGHGANEQGACGATPCASVRDGAAIYSGPPATLTSRLTPADEPSPYATRKPRQSRADVVTVCNGVTPNLGRADRAGQSRALRARMRTSTHGRTGLCCESGKASICPAHADHTRLRGLPKGGFVVFGEPLGLSFPRLVTLCPIYEFRRGFAAQRNSAGAPPQRRGTPRHSACYTEYAHGITLTRSACRVPRCPRFAAGSRNLPVPLAALPGASP